MATTHSRRLTRCLESFTRVLPHRLEHPEPRAIPNDQAVVDEAGQPIEHGPPDDRLTRVNRPSGVEDGELLKQSPLLCVQEVVAPAEHRPQGAMTRRSVSPPGGEQLEPSPNA